MDTISNSETSVLGKFYMHQENNVPFMTKHKNFAFFPWTLLGHSSKNTDIKVLVCEWQLWSITRVSY